MVTVFSSADRRSLAEVFDAPTPQTLPLGGRLACKSRCDQSIALQASRPQQMQLSVLRDGYLHSTSLGGRPGTTTRNKMQKSSREETKLKKSSSRAFVTFVVT
ncbi:hypothetical protein MTO96_002271 [Rhipicephalus appendiculatus]